MTFRLMLLALLALAFPQMALAQSGGAQAAGTLISADPVVETPGGMQAWSIRYWTTDQDGRPSQVTGMVVAPREAMPAQPRPVIAWAHGTWGVVQKCAPSLSPDFFTATPGLTEMIKRGYVVVAPDYPGLGTDMPHPYLLGQDTARSVLDAVRAARQIAGAAAGPRMAVWGESQGGHAALWTSVISRSYAPELTLVGTVAAAPPTDLPANLNSGSDLNVRAMLTAFTAYSWSQRYGFPLSSLFGKFDQGVATRLAQNNCIALGKKPKLGTILGVTQIRKALKNKNIGTIAPWAAVARANSVDPRAVNGSLLVVQSVSDPIVAPAITAQFARARCRTGARVQYVSLPGGDHGNTARDSAAVTIDWIGARFAGRTAPTTCGKI
jgi:acetyl esterase/lipase